MAKKDKVTPANEALAGPQGEPENEFGPYTMVKEVEVIKEVFVPIEPIDADRERLEKVVKNAVIYAGQTSRLSEKVTTILETIEADFRIVAKPEPEKEEEVTE